MNILIGIAAYAFAVINTTVSVLWHWRDESKEKKRKALIISQIVAHIVLIIILLDWLNGNP